MLVAKKSRQCFGGFILSLATVVLTAASLQFILSSIWTPPQSFLVAYGTALAISLTAIASSWVGLLLLLKNRAMIRGVRYQIYASVGVAIVGLIVALFW